ncbi:MAG: hypothetical protein DID89_2727547279, partial [Candidatus Nitrotoga sp. CP45]
AAAEAPKHAANPNRFQQMAGEELKESASHMHGT